MACLRSSVGISYLPNYWYHSKYGIPSYARNNWYQSISISFTTNGIRADCVRSRLKCSRWRRCQVDGVRRRHQDEEDNKKVQICSKVKIDDFWGILIKVESSRLMLKSEHGRCEGDDRIIANGGWQDGLDELTETSHKESHGGSLRQQVKGKNSGGWWRRSMDEIDWKVNRAIIVRFWRSRYRTLCFSAFWM